MEKGLPIEHQGKSLAEIDINDMLPEEGVEGVYGFT